MGIDSSSSGVSELIEWDDFAAPIRDSSRVCVCSSCSAPAEIEMQCEFCEAHCIFSKLHRQYEKALAGILAWRTHIVRDALEEEGLDAVLWWPRVLELGTLDAALRLHHECIALDMEFKRKVGW